MEITPELEERLKKLQEKYAVMGQDMLSYLDGLIYSDYLNYWEYINLDVLLNLQHPKTSQPDEIIFICYHQITELYFKLILHAVKQINEKDNLNAAFFTKHLVRINSYVDNLIHSFEIMIDGMDKSQFLKFRMALLPASGFQSAQIREIEICSTDLYNLVSFQDRKKVDSKSPVEEVYKYLYWKRGATELATGKKTLTLKQFEEKYSESFISLANRYKNKNLLQKYRSLPAADKQNVKLVEELRKFDLKLKVHWPLMHYKSAVRYLQKDPEDIKATGGTNWQQFLAPKNQVITFFPELWSKEELENWGKQAVKELFAKL